MAVAVAGLVDNYFVAPRVALANGDREMIIWIYMYLQQPNICHRIGKFYSIA